MRPTDRQRGVNFPTWKRASDDTHMLSTSHHACFLNGTARASHTCALSPETRLHPESVRFVISDAPSCSHNRANPNLRSLHRPRPKPLLAADPSAAFTDPLSESLSSGTNCELTNYHISCENPRKRSGIARFKGMRAGGNTARGRYQGCVRRSLALRRHHQCGLGSVLRAHRCQGSYGGTGLAAIPEASATGAPPA